MNYLKLIPAKIWLVAITLSLASAGYVGFIHYEREIGKREILLSQYSNAEMAARHDEGIAKRQADSLKSEIKERDSVLVATATEFDKAAKKYHVIRDTLVLTNDAQILEIVEAADSALAEGEQALAQAQQAIHVRDLLIVVQDSALKAADRRIAALQQINKIVKPGARSRFGNIVKLGLAVAVGYEIGLHR